MNAIFTHFISRSYDGEKGDKRLAYLSWFVDQVPATEFEGDELLFYEYLKFSDKISVPLVFKYLQVWCSSELREVLHRTEARVLGCEMLRFDDPASFETIYQTTVKVLEDNFKVLETMESDVDDFKVEIAAYFTQKKRDVLTKALSRTFNLLNETDSVESASEFISLEVGMADEIYDIESIEELEISERRSIDDVEFDFVSDTGIPAIDNDSGGISTCQMFGVEGQSGAGKTRFVMGTYVYRALTLYSKNVLFCALEQKASEIEAMLVACHVFHMFNVQINDNMILKNKIPDELKATVEAAKLDLFESGKYGKFVCQEKMLYVETFISKLRVLDKLKGPFDLICIDYMGIMESKPLNKYERVKEMPEIVRQGYKLFKRYVRNHNKAGIALGQLNSEGTTAGEQDKEIQQNMAQGGMPVFQNADYNFEITATPTMRLQQKRRISQAKVRGTAGFPRFLVDVRLGFLFFRQITQNKV